MSHKLAIISTTFTENLMFLEDMATSFKSTIIISPSLDKKSIIKNIKDCDSIILGSYPIMAIINDLPNLKYISKLGVGLDNIDIDVLEKRGIKVALSKGVNARAVAELVLARMIQLSRNLHLSESVIRNGGWLKIKGRELTEINIGIIGYGSVGKKVCKILDQVGVSDNHIRIYDQFVNIGTSLDLLLASSDIITIHIQGTADNINFFDKDKFIKMKKGSCIINTSRGNIINTNDIIDALGNGTLKGCALDVFDNEPVIDDRLRNHSKVLLSCHQGSLTERTMLKSSDVAIKNLIKLY